MKTLRLVLLSSFIAAPLAAQRLPDAGPVVRNPFTVQQGAGAPPAYNAAGTLIGAVLGAAAGGYAGILIATRGPCNYEDCHANALVLLVPAGITLGTAAGAHLGDGGRGNFGNDVAASVVTAVAGIGFMVVAKADFMILATPILQVLVTTVVETSDAAARARAAPPQR